MIRPERLDKQGCGISGQAQKAGGEGGQLSPLGKALVLPESGSIGAMQANSVSALIDDVL